jgi:glycoside/pentoside/hexuronide:cation symporter, GPH family
MTHSSPPPAPPQMPRSPRLSLATKLAFGAGDAGAGITSTLLVFSFLVFLTDVAHLKPGLASSVLAIGKIWDAFNDPIIGVLSDRTRSKWGRRHAWMIGAAIPFGFLFYLHWIVPPFLSSDESQMGLFWYYVAVSIAFNTAFTAVNLPYTALSPQMTQDYDERTSLTGFRFAFSIGGSLAALAFGFVLSQQNLPAAQQYVLLGGISAIASILTIYWCVWGTTDPTAGEAPSINTTEPQTSWWQEIRDALQNVPFRYVIGIYLCSWFAFQLTATTIPYFVTYYMGVDSYFAVALIVQGSAMLALFLWAKLGETIGRRGVYFLGTGLWTIAQAGLFMITPDHQSLMYLLCALAGIGIATAYLVPWSMITDVTDLGELQTGERREGTFYSLMVLLQKLGLAFGLAMVGQALEWFGFDSTLPVQSDSVLTALRVLVAPFPACILAIGLVLAYFYPLTKSVHAQILLELSERHHSSKPN